MADLGNIGGMVSSATTGLYWLIIFLFGTGLIVGLIVLTMYKRMFKHQVIIRKITNNRKVISIDYARTLVRTEVHYWQLYNKSLFKKKKLISAPPSDAIDVKENGVLYAECYWKEDNPEPTWIIDRYDNTVPSLDPFTTQERSLYVQRLEDAVLRKGKSILEWIMQVTPIFAVLVILVLMLIYWESITKPVVELSKDNVAISSQNSQILRMNTNLVVVLAEAMGRGDLLAKMNVTQQIPQGGG